MLRYPGACEKHITMAEAARDVRRLCQEAETAQDTNRALLSLLSRLDELLVILKGHHQNSETGRD